MAWLGLRAFEEWLEAVDKAVQRRHDTSIFDLEEGVPEWVLHMAYESGIPPEDFVDQEVSQLFVPVRLAFD